MPVLHLSGHDVIVIYGLVAGRSCYSPPRLLESPLPHKYSNNNVKHEFPKIIILRTLSVFTVIVLELPQCQVVQLEAFY